MSEEYDTTGCADEIISIANRAIAEYKKREIHDLRERAFRDVVKICNAINLMQFSGNVEVAQMWDGVQFALINGGVYAKTNSPPPDWMSNKDLMTQK